MEWVEKMSTSFYSLFWAQAQSSRVILLPIFQEQIRIDSAKRLWGFHEKPSKHLTVFSLEKVNIYKNGQLNSKH